jgi:hypothetical protein
MQELSTKNRVLFYLSRACQRVSWILWSSVGIALLLTILSFALRMFVWCPGCGHGGHLDHALQWFGGLNGQSVREVCPAGCGTYCIKRFCIFLLRPTLTQIDNLTIIQVTSATLCSNSAHFHEQGLCGTSTARKRLPIQLLKLTNCLLDFSAGPQFHLVSSYSRVEGSSRGLLSSNYA